MDKPMLIYQKNAEVSTNKIRLPKKFVEINGNRFYMEVYRDFIKLIPINKGK